MMPFLSAYSFTADTAVLVAGPMMIFAPCSCSFFIAAKLSSGLVFESAISKLKWNDELVVVS
jgi:hypothetical protein